MIKKSMITLVALSFVTGSFYAGYIFYTTKRMNVKLGYGKQCINLPTSVFKRGQWKGVLLDADITHTDGAHNMLPYDLDNDGKVELIANSYRSDTLILYKYKNNLDNEILTKKIKRL